MTIAIKSINALCFDGALPFLAIHPGNLFTPVESEVSTRFYTAALIAAVKERSEVIQTAIRGVG